MKQEKLTNFYNLNEALDFAAEEERIASRWKDIDAFKIQLKKTENFKKFSFFDGPPFATGLPHYGHICAGTIKDIITRYAAQTGHYVLRRWGWDCHGLPIEHEVDKMLNIKTSEDYKKIGVKQYNEKCRSIIMTYANEWERVITRTGRWIDFKNDYRTLQPTFMESVWWVFKTLFEKGLIYRGCKIMPYSTGCQTVLSNFEANQNYQDVHDPSIYITFPMKNDPKIKFLAWTTTPWTLPSNLAIVVNPTFTYLKYIEVATNETYIVAECRIKNYYKKETEYKVLEKILGKDLEGIEYEPLFNYFIERRKDGCFRVLCDNFVASDSGTGIVHCAPGFGEDDYQVSVKKNIIQPDNPACPINDYGCFTAEVKDYVGMYVKDADAVIKKDLKARGRLVHTENILHSYPFCWRTNTPLLYRSMHCWFVRVTSLREKLLANNKSARWVPKYVQEKRFHNWLEGCVDWCISRTRLWGNPLPLWVSDDYEEIVCVGSIEELEKLSGKTGISDIHREFVDEITIPSKKGKGVLHRVPEVLDCWFESGSMPYAQSHYPFSMNEKEFSEIFPCDFIAEGLDQTRGWFYTLLVLGTALFDKCPFKNLIVNGLVLAADGSKMSKSKKNFPDPMNIINQYGADAMRLYLCNSPLVRAEPLSFKEDGVKGIIKNVFLPWFNAHKFLLQNIERYESENNKKFWFEEDTVYQMKNLSNPIDRWLVGNVENLIDKVRKEMESYKLYKVLPKLMDFLEDLTNCYVRLNRSRMKGEGVTQQESFISLNVLFNSILKSAILMGCYVPFITELIYENLKKCIDPKSCYYEESIHFIQIPQPKADLIDLKIIDNVKNMRAYIELGRQLRENNKSTNSSFKYPIQSCTLIHLSKEALDAIDPLTKYIQEEINVMKIEKTTDFNKYVDYTCLPDNKLLGKRLGKQFGQVAKSLRTLTSEMIESYIKNKKLTIDGVDILEGELIINRKPKSQNLQKSEIIGGENSLYILLNTHQDESMKNIGLAREFSSKIQMLRKTSKLVPLDKIIIVYKFLEPSTKVEKAVEQEIKLIQSILKRPIMEKKHFQSHLKLIDTKIQDVENDKFEISLYWNKPLFHTEKMAKDFGANAETLQQALLCYDFKYSETLFQQKKPFICNLDKEYKVLPNEHFYIVE